MIEVGLAIGEGVELLWLIVLTVAWVVQRHRHDRLMYRVSTLSKSITKAIRQRHTGSQPRVSIAQPTQLYNKPPPYPVPPPSTSPIRPTGGRHAR